LSAGLFELECDLVSAQGWVQTCGEYNYEETFEITRMFHVS
jgi:hypothetical protein